MFLREPFWINRTDVTVLFLKTPKNKKFGLLSGNLHGFLKLSDRQSGISEIPVGRAGTARPKCKYYPILEAGLPEEVERRERYKLEDIIEVYERESAEKETA